MIPSEKIRRRILTLQKARDACLRRYNRTTNPQVREILQLTTQALTATQFQLQADLHLLTDDGQTNGN